jgi:iron complex transport system substrate-binding protein
VVKYCIVFLFFLLFLFTAAVDYERSFKSVVHKKPPERIVALAPSISELLYHIGAGDRVIARSRYAEYPPDVLELPSVGGLLDINYDAIMRLMPDLVIVSDIQSDVAERLRKLGINTLMVNHQTFDGVLVSFSEIGNLLDVDTSLIVSDMLSSVEAVASRTKGFEGNRRAAVVVARDGGKVIVAGDDGYYSKIFDMLGVVNPYSEYAAYISISAESLKWAKLDKMPELLYTGEDVDDVCIISGSYGYTPGPRFVNLFERLARCLYPEFF